MVEPSLTTLFPNSSLNAFSNLRPLGDVLGDAIDDSLIFFPCPRPLHESSLLGAEGMEELQLVSPLSADVFGISTKFERDNLFRSDARRQDYEILGV